jgi:hypothetical protein
MTTTAMKFWFTNIILLAFGLGSCTGSYYLGESSLSKLRNWDTAEGTLVDFTTKPSKAKWQGAILKFSHQGKEYQFKSQLTSNDVSYHTPVTVMFPKDDPSHAEARQYGFLLGFPFALLFLGFVLCGIGYGSIRRRLKGLPDAVDESQLKPNPQLQGLRDYLEDLNKKS